MDKGFVLLTTQKLFLDAWTEVTCLNESKSVFSRQSPSSVLFLLQEHGNTDFASDYWVTNKFLLTHTSQANSRHSTEMLSSECVAGAPISKNRTAFISHLSTCTAFTEQYIFAHVTFCITVTDAFTRFIIRFAPFLCEIQASFEDDENICT